MRKTAFFLSMQEAHSHQKFGIAPANCVGVVDWDYRVEIICALHNSSDKDYTINNWRQDRTAP